MKMKFNKDKFLSVFSSVLGVIFGNIFLPIPGVIIAFVLLPSSLMILLYLHDEYQIDDVYFYIPYVFLVMIVYYIAEAIFITPKIPFFR